jgi:3-deoxy-D-manno-octulosonic acid kinase
MAMALTEVGVPTPAVLAGVRYAAGLGHRSDVMTERAEGRDLADIFFGDAPPAQHAREPIWRAVGALVRRLHDAGFVHDDLQLRNILVERLFDPPVPPSPDSAIPRAWLLDVDTCRRIAPGNLSARRQNLARFDRSWDKWNRLHGAKLSAWDHEVFTAAYVGRGA